MAELTATQHPHDAVVAALRDSELRYRALAEAAEDGIFILNSDFKIEYANEAMLQELYRAGVMTPESGMAYQLPPEEADRLRRDVQQVFSTNESLLIDRPVALQFGKNRWMSIRYVPITGFTGRRCVMGIVRDVGPLKRAEEAARESARRYRTLLDNLPLAVFLKDRDGRYISVNQQFAHHAGKSPAQIVGTTDYEVFAERRAEQYREDDSRIMTAGVVEEYDQDFFRDGQSLILHKIKVPVKDDDGRVTGILGMMSDVTTQRHLEETFARQRQFVDAILNAIPGLLCLVDDQGHPIHWNAQVEELLEYSPDEIACLHVTDFYAADSKQKAAEALAASLGGTRATIEANLVTKSGNRLPFYIVIVPVTITGRTYVLGVGVNVAEQKRTQEALRLKELELQEGQRQAYSRMQALSRQLLEIQEAERRSLARELHDELGQSLTATKITLQTLERYPDPNTLPSRLADARAIVDGALEQVRSLSLGLRPPLLDDLGLSAALRWLLDQYGKRSGMRVLFVDLADGRRADTPIETACFRIAQEALTNATKHADASTVCVELSEENGALHLHVRDDGLGFDVAAARARASGGASLGLMSMEERATLAGGRIEWTSGSGLGTDVHAWFPLGG